MTLPTDSQARKGTPVFSGFLNYFPLAIAEVARLSLAANEKHNPGEPLHWSKDKSTDHADCVARHLLEHTTFDPEDGFGHDVKVAWRAMALLQTRLEREAATDTAHITETFHRITPDPELRGPDTDQYGKTGRPQITLSGYFHIVNAVDMGLGGELADRVVFGTYRSTGDNVRQWWEVREDDYSFRIKPNDIDKGYAVRLHGGFPPAK